MKIFPIMSTPTTLVVLLTALVVFPLGWYAGQVIELPSNDFFSPFIAKQTRKKNLPLQQYSIENLSQRNYKASELMLEDIINETAAIISYRFSYTTLGKKMTGELKMPRSAPADPKVIVMVRGFIPPEQYQTGSGTKNAAEYFALKGYITLAPDFFGFGGSDAEPTDSWEARFVKPIVVIELLESIKANGLPSKNSSDSAKTTIVRPAANHIGIWAHSNGGQIALTALEALGQPIPTTLWAPVTAPFPYSILYYSDEELDEGKSQRAWLGLFERDYNVFDFSLTQHLDRLRGPLQLQQGTNDDAVLKWWSDEFVAKIKTENRRRAGLGLTAAVPPIDLTYHLYPDADHNLQPTWNKVVQRDVQFFEKNLK